MVLVSVEQFAKLFTGQFAKLLYVLLLIGLLAGCRAEDESWPRIEASGVLRVGLDPTYPPFELADDRPLEGYDVDLARAIAADLGLEAEFTYFGYDGLYDALQTGQVDVLISGLVVSPERTRDFAYSDSYFNAGQLLIGPETADIGTVESLNGRTLAVELGAEGHVMATTWERQLPELTILPYNSPDDALTAMVTGEADAVLIDSISGRLFLKNQPEAQLSTKYRLTAVSEEPFALVTRIDDHVLLDKLNESLGRLKDNGILDGIDSRWLGQADILSYTLLVSIF